MLCDFGYYKEQYCGTAITDESDFIRLCSRAESLLRVHTGVSDLSAYPEVKDCVCELCDLYCQSERRDGVKSESTDGLSITFDGDPAGSRKTAEVIRRRLFRTGLLYRGVTRC